MKDVGDDRGEMQAGWKAGANRFANIRGGPAVGRWRGGLAHDGHRWGSRQAAGGGFGQLSSHQAPKGQRQVVPLAYTPNTEPQRNALKMAYLLLTWYMLSALSNNVSKLVLGQLPFPLTVSIVQSVPTVLAFIYINITKAMSRPHSKARVQYAKVGLGPFLAEYKWGALLGVCSVSGSFFHRVALMRIHVSFIHTVKACQPFFAVLLARFCLKERLRPSTYLTLVPIVAGVAIAAYTEVHFDMLGFNSALFSSCAFCSSNIFVKRMMNAQQSTGNGDKGFDKDAAFYFQCIYALLIQLFLWPLVDGPKVFAHQMDAGHTLWLLALAAVLTTLQSYVSMTVLSMITSVSHAIATVMKRIFVICLALAYFGNPITPLHAFGILMSTVGVGLYQISRKREKKGLPMSAVHSVGDISAWGTKYGNSR